MSVSVGFEIALLCRCDDTAALHKAEPMCHKLRQAVTAKTDYTKHGQRHRTAHSKHSRLHRIAQLDRAAKNRTSVHKILRDKVNIPLFA